LREDDLAILIDHDQAVQKVSIARLPVGSLLDPTHEIRAAHMLRKPNTPRTERMNRAT